MLRMHDENPDIRTKNQGDDNPVPSYLKGLNDRQKEAVLATDGPLLILAGAGAGKTKTLTHRILNLLYKGTDPDRILAITFTNKAAREMRDRLIRLIENDRTLNFPVATNRFPLVSTFHSLGVYILRKFGHVIGTSKNFTIYDRSDSKQAVKDALNSLGHDPKQFEPGKILGTISRAKGDALTIEQFKVKRPDYYGDIVASTWEKYESILNKDKALDFDDLLQKTVILLEQSKEVRDYYQNRFQYIHIDEYQDTNAVQYRMAELLCGPAHNIAVVGDIDQAIYGWRGARIANMLRFEKDFPGGSMILLEENYRSTKNILEAANDVIAKNIFRKEKNLFTSNGDGEKISLYVAMDENDEAGRIGDTIESLIKKGISPDEIAILYRANFQSRALEDACLFRNVPYHVLGTKFFDRKEVKDLLSYVKLALNIDSGADIKRVINTPIRGIGKTTVLKVLEGKKNELADSFKIKVNNFFMIISDIRSYALSHLPSETVKYALSRSGLETELKNEDDDERLENARELVTLAKRYDEIIREKDDEGAEMIVFPKNTFELSLEQSLEKYLAPENRNAGDDGKIADSNSATSKSPEQSEQNDQTENQLWKLEKFIEDACLLGEQDTIDDKDKKGPCVKLMTVHASKGLEFDHVFITGLEQDLFPHVRHGDSSSAKEAAPEDAEEERRLFYVALTRARHKLHLSYALIRTIFGNKVFNQMSPFIEDINPELIQTENPGGGQNRFGGDFGDGLLSRLIEF
jgi:DNA helicase-2/ATP-dependent DNA helicase PcrA